MKVDDSGICRWRSEANEGRGRLLDQAAVSAAVDAAGEAWQPVRHLREKKDGDGEDNGGGSRLRGGTAVAAAKLKARKSGRGERNRERYRRAIAETEREEIPSPRHRVRRKLRKMEDLIFRLNERRFSFIQRGRNSYIRYMVCMRTPINRAAAGSDRRMRRSFVSPEKRAPIDIVTVVIVENLSWRKRDGGPSIIGFESGTLR